MIRPSGSPTVLLAGGGSGGHLFPGLAVAERIVRRHAGARVLLAATDREAKAPHGAGCPLEVVELGSPRLPKGPMGASAFGFRMTQAVARSVRILRDEAVEVVVGLGGYGSVAPGVAARLAGVPLLLLEQNAVPGKATRVLSRIGSVTAASFDGLAGRGVRGSIELTGNPVRSHVLRPWPAHERLGLRPGVPVLAVFGGSLGAVGLNQRFVRALGPLQAATYEPGAERAAFQVIHAVGNHEPVEPYVAAYRRFGITACVRPFFHEMGAVYGTADVLLCRAGGTTVAELTALGKPAVLVPYPHHGDAHQRENALPLVEKGAATLLEEEDMTPEAIVEHLAPLLRDPETRARRARESRRLGRPEAAERVADLVLSLGLGRRRGTRVGQEVLQ